jgi:thiazole synthase
MQEARGRSKANDGWLYVNGVTFRSRLLVGLEQYTDFGTVDAVLRASGTDVLIATFDLEGTRAGLALTELDALSDDQMTWIGTTSFARSADEAVETALLLNRSLNINVIKLDVRDNQGYPDIEGTLVAARELVGLGFGLLPFIIADIDHVRALEQIGCVAVRVMASAVGSGHGLDNVASIASLIEESRLPVVVEGGLGIPAHAVQAMELGADAVLVNRAISTAPSPARMAAEFKAAVETGHRSYLARYAAETSEPNQ